MTLFKMIFWSLILSALCVVISGAPPFTALDKGNTDELCMGRDRLAMEIACKSVMQNSFFQEQKVKYNTGGVPMCFPLNVVRKISKVSQREKGHQETTENRGIGQIDDTKEKLKGTVEDDEIYEIASTRYRPEVKTNYKIQDRIMFLRTMLVCPSVKPDPDTGRDITYAWYFSATDQYDPNTNHLVFYVFEPVHRNPKYTVELSYFDLTMVTVKMVLMNKRDPLTQNIKTEKEKRKNKAQQDEELMNKKRKNGVQRNEAPDNEELRNTEIESEQPENKELKYEGSMSKKLGS